MRVRGFKFTNDSLGEKRRRLFAFYERKLEEMPIRSNCFTASLLGLVGDIICQKVVEGRTEINWTRCGSFVFFCCYYQGMVDYYIYKWYADTLAKYTLSSLQSGVIMSLVDNFIHVPLLYTPAFYVTVGLLQGDSLELVQEKIQTELWPTVYACWFVWIPLQAVNFGLVPPQYRVGFVNVGCVLWNVILDSISQGAWKKRQKPRFYVGVRNAASLPGADTFIVVFVVSLCENGGNPFVVWRSRRNVIVVVVVVVVVLSISVNSSLLAKLLSNILFYAYTHTELREISINVIPFWRNAHKFKFHTVCSTNQHIFHYKNYLQYIMFTYVYMFVSLFCNTSTRNNVFVFKYIFCDFFYV